MTPMAGHDAIGILLGAGTEATSTQLRVAKHIPESRKADFDPRLLEDRYRTVLASMLREASETDTAISTAAHAGECHQSDGCAETPSYGRAAVRIDPPTTSRGFQIV